MRSRTAVLAAVGASAAMILTGCGSSSDGADGGNATVTVTVATTEPQATTAPPTPAAAPPPPSSAPPPPAPSAAAGLSPRTAAAVRALATATAAVPDGRPYELDHDDDDGRRSWKIEVASGNDRPHELVVSADGRNILDRGRDNRDDDTDLALSAQVTLADALRTADRRVGGDLDEAEIDRERGTTAWSVKFDEPARDREHEVLVDAATGRVIHVETDEDD